MGFFKDFKDDLSEAVDELIPGSAQETDPALEEELAVTPDTFETDLNVEDELSKLDGLLEQAAKNVSAEEKSASDAGEKPDKGKPSDRLRGRAADVKACFELVAAGPGGVCGLWRECTGGRQLSGNRS